MAEATQERRLLDVGSSAMLNEAPRAVSYCSVAERSLPLVNVVEMLCQPRAQLLLHRWGQLQDHLDKAPLRKGHFRPHLSCSSMYALS